jgi:hypothetical protein
MAAMRGRDTKTRYQGVFARHQQACRKTATGDAKACHCTPSYFGVVWDRADHKHRIDLKLGALELAADEAGRKPGGLWRVFHSLSRR